MRVSYHTLVTKRPNYLNQLVEIRDNTLLKLEEIGEWLLKMMLEAEEEGLTNEMFSLEVKTKGKEGVVNILKKSRKVQYSQIRQDCETIFSSPSDTEKEKRP